MKLKTLLSLFIIAMLFMGTTKAQHGKLGETGTLTPVLTGNFADQPIVEVPEFGKLLQPLYKTLTTSVIIGEGFACMVNNVGNFPVTVNLVQVINNQKPLVREDYTAQEFDYSCPAFNYENPIVLQPNESCAVYFVSGKNGDYRNTSAFCKIIHANGNYKVKGAMESFKYETILTSGPIAVPSGIKRVFLRAEATE